MQYSEPSMLSVSVNQFRDNLEKFVDQVVHDHCPIKVTRRSADSVVVISAEDWERDQETLYVLQNSSLMGQIAVSSETCTKRKGKKFSAGGFDEITDL